MNVQELQVRRLETQRQQSRGGLVRQRHTKPIWMTGRRKSIFFAASNQPLVCPPGLVVFSPQSLHPSPPTLT